MLRCVEGKDARRGGLDLVLSLTKGQAEALGPDAAEIADALHTVLVGLAALRTGRDPVRAGGPSPKDRPVSSGTDWHEWLLRDLTTLGHRLEGVEDATVRAYDAAGGSHGALATATAVFRETAISRRKDVVRKDPGATELWATGKNGSPDQSGLRVSDNMRPWSVNWPGYRRLRVDVTRPELREPGLKASVKEGWAEPYATAAEVPDWPKRRAQALVPFDLDEHGEPQCPLGRTGRTGNVLGRLAEVPMVNSIVVAGEGLDRQVLLILSEHLGQWGAFDSQMKLEQWGVPSGRIKEGESVDEALVRNLLEQTGLDLSAETPVMFDPWINYHDMGTTDTSWAASAPGLFVLDRPLPVKGGDDAADVRWYPFVSMQHLILNLEGGRYDMQTGALYQPHYGRLYDALKHVER